MKGSKSQYESKRARKQAPKPDLTDDHLAPNVKKGAYVPEGRSVLSGHSNVPGTQLPKTKTEVEHFDEVVEETAEAVDSVDFDEAIDDNPFDD